MDTHQPVTKHYIWVDYAKFLIIFLVVFYHNPPPLYGIPEESLLLLRMPGFFFLSGLLFRIDKYPSFTRYAIHRSKQLLIPYFYFFVILYAYWLIRGHIAGATPEIYDAPFYQPIVEFLSGTPQLVGLPLWFIPCLFITQCAYYIVFKGMNRTTAVVLLLLFPFIPELVNLENSPFSLHKVCQGITFYGIASLYRKELFQFIEKGNKLLLGIACLITSLFIAYISLKLSHSFLLLSIKIAGSFSIILSFIILMKWLSDFLGKNRFIEEMAANTIIILALHIRGMVLFRKLIQWLFHVPETFIDESYLLKFVIAALSTISMIAPIWLINKYFPFIIGKSKDRKTLKTTESQS